MARSKPVRQMPRRRRIAPRASFGAVSAINTAPVSIGNSVRGSKPRITQTTDGARVVGRDFAFALSGTASSVINWELIGAMPITPSVMPSSILRNYAQMFNKFKVNSVSFHYITSSPTNQAGDVMFYYEKDRVSPAPDYSSSSFLPFVLSDPHTVIGPQWTNHSIKLSPAKDFKTTLYGNQTDLNEDAEGTIFFFSKTNAVNSPGYLLIDYDYTFKELSVNPRAGTLPVARGVGTMICLNPVGGIVDGNAVALQWTVGNTISGFNTNAPTGSIVGDIYKIVCQTTASRQTNVWVPGAPAITNANLFKYGTTNRALNLDDGTTFYLSWNNAGTLGMFPTLEAAVTNTDPIEYGVTPVGGNFFLCAEVHLVRNVTDFTQSSY